MKKIDIYTSPFCGFCHRAKALLKSKNAPFNEISIATDPSKRGEMMQRSNGGRTVPQIFIGDTHVGGCDELYAMERANKLDALLKK